VVGAQVNETFQSANGLDPSAFPATMPTYTGHYHRPHVVEGTNIHYVGSPYQVGAIQAKPALKTRSAGGVETISYYRTWKDPGERTC
jgi:hypothetical protein